MRCVVSCSSTSFPLACILLWSSAVKVHDSQAYRKMDVTRERISRILKLREILLSIQTGFSLVNAAVVISGLEPSSVITEPRYLELVAVSSFCSSRLAKRNSSLRRSTRAMSSANRKRIRTGKLYCHSHRKENSAKKAYRRDSRI